MRTAVSIHQRLLRDLDSVKNPATEPLRDLARRAVSIDISDVVYDVINERPLELNADDDLEAEDGFVRIRLPEPIEGLVPRPLLVVPQTPPPLLIEPHLTYEGDPFDGELQPDYVSAFLIGPPGDCVEPIVRTWNPHEGEPIETDDPDVRASTSRVEVILATGVLKVTRCNIPWGAPILVEDRKTADAWLVRFLAALAAGILPVDVPG